MEIIKHQSNNKITLEITGTINTETASILQDEISNLDFDNLDLTLDFAGTDYITSAGLRVLLVARKNLSEDAFRVINVNENIVSIFETSGFSTIIPFRASDYLQEATALSSTSNLSFKGVLRKKIAHSADIEVFQFLGRDYTWMDIEKASQIVADDLANAGVGHGTHVGICSMNSINWIISFFAIQKLGGIAVLVNPGLMPNEIIQLSHIADITHLCYAGIPTKTEYASFSQALKVKESKINWTYDISFNIDFTSRYDEYENIKDRYQEDYDPDDPGIIIFTSGSTGLPKAVLMSADNLFYFAKTFVKPYKYTKEDRQCSFLPFFHVFGLETGIAIPCMLDIKSFIPAGISASIMLDTIWKNKCTVFHTVPTMILAIMQNPDFTTEKVASLRFSALGGANTTKDQYKILSKAFPNNHFVNVYGMSENLAISVTDYEDTEEHIIETVGHIVDGVECEIRDIETKKVLPNGEVGEIYVRSNNMIVCYYKLPIENQPLDENGWLATGDLGLIDKDNYLRLTGRVKELIIRGGENIAPNEIADAITDFPSIADAKVVGIPHDILGEQVAAGIVMKENCSFSENELKEFLSTKLAKYKIPEYFVTFDSFPILGSGKLDAQSIRDVIIKTINK